jgi:uncharacterized protein with HEPN domain
MKTGDFDRIRHIQRYYVAINVSLDRFSTSFDIFLSNQDFLRSVSMCLMQIGELAGTLSDSFKEGSRDQMQWGIMKGMRNRFAHSYNEMDKREIWKTATQDIPVLH